MSKVASPPQRKVLLKGYRGSIAHNLHIPREADDIFGIDDIDYLEFFTYPKEYYFSLPGYYHMGEVIEDIHAEIDSVAYEIRKVFHLLSQCNPNVLLFLYNRREDYQTMSAGGELLLKNRDIFLNKNRVYKAFAGYAQNQLSKLEKGVFRGYMGEKRKRIVKKFGYDTKNATTLIRLLHQGKELLATGELIVYRQTDRQLLLDIKQGKYSLEALKDMANHAFVATEKAYQNSQLPNDNNSEQINLLLAQILKHEVY